MAECKQCDITNQIRASRATWLCRGCGRDVSIEFIYYMKATIPADTGSLEGAAGKVKRKERTK